jgi:hypothetical protein
VLCWRREEATVGDHLTAEQLLHELAEALRSERDEARRTAVEAVEELRDVLPYKCEHLAEKHGNNETLARLQAVVTGWGGANRGE